MCLYKVFRRFCNKRVESLGLSQKTLAGSPLAKSVAFPAGILSPDWSVAASRPIGRQYARGKRNVIGQWTPGLQSSDTDSSGELTVARYSD